MRLESILIATSSLFTSALAWTWAKEGIASMTWYTDYSHENLACNCVPSSMVVGPTVALAEVAYGAFDHFGSGPACGLCYRLSPYATADGTPLSPKPEPIVFRVTDECPHQSNAEWGPGPEGGLNAHGFDPHFDVNIESWDGKLRDWFQGGHMQANFELVSCEEWPGWSDDLKTFTGTHTPYWGCCPANPGLLENKSTMCGSPKESVGQPPSEGQRVKPTDFPWLDGSSSGSKATTTTTKASEQTTESCWSTKLGYKCCKGCDVSYTDDDGDWGFEDDWCGIPTSCKSTTTTDSCTKSGYPCCKDCNVLYTDDTGKWGVMDGDWCAISDSCSPSNATKDPNCPAKGYECCNGCNVVDNSDGLKWGVENDQWCIIKSTC
jgi:hypothetical protein